MLRHQVQDAIEGSRGLQRMTHYHKSGQAKCVKRMGTGPIAMNLILGHAINDILRNMSRACALNQLKACFCFSHGYRLNRKCHINIPLRDIKKWCCW